MGELIADPTGGQVIFPFDGPPFPPFLSWAAKAGRAVSSRLSLFIHEEFGLWHAYRFALALPEWQERLPARAEFKSPCLSCEKKPCLDACPASAFSGESYRVEQCMDYPGNDPESGRQPLGCASRRACPEGRAFAYEPAHAAFHMDAFVRTRLLKGRL